MFHDRIIIVAEMAKDKAIELIKTLPKEISKQNKRKGHKFVFTLQKELIIGRADQGNPKHSDLGDPKKDKIAGYIFFEIDENDYVAQVYLNNQSKDFNYPQFEKLKEPQLFIKNLFDPKSIDMEHIPKPENKIIVLPSSSIH